VSLEWEVGFIAGKGVGGGERVGGGTTVGEGPPEKLADGGGEFGWSSRPEWPTARVRVGTRLRARP
jgi:hypothetical protein